MQVRDETLRSFNSGIIKLLLVIIAGSFLSSAQCRTPIESHAIREENYPSFLSSTTRVTLKSLNGCSGRTDLLVRSLGPVRCPCFLSYEFGSTVDASWDIFFLEDSSYKLWEAKNFQGDPSSYDEEYTFRDVQTLTTASMIKLQESNIYLIGNYNIVFRAIGQKQICFHSASTYVFEPMPSPCPVETRIVGGTEVSDPQQYKWMASIWHSDIRPVCGGSLINPGYVLTAAHCQIHISPQSYKVRIGVVTANQGKAFPVLRAWAHPEFEELPSGVALNDLAVLELSSFDNSKSTVIPWNTNTSFPDDNTFVTTAGFGHISENWPALPVPNRLLRVDIPVVPTSKCADLYRSIEKGIHLCAGYLDGGCDSCQGDSGGPLYAKDNNNETKLVGLVSFGTGCARRRAPGVYTRLSHYSRWINETISRGSASRRSSLALGNWAIAGISIAGLVTVVVGSALAIIVLKRRQENQEGVQADEEGVGQAAVFPSRQPSTVPSTSGISG